MWVSRIMVSSRGADLVQLNWEADPQQGPGAVYEVASRDIQIVENDFLATLTDSGSGSFLLENPIAVSPAQFINPIPKTSQSGAAVERWHA